VATRPCEECIKWQYDEQTGKIATRGRGKDERPVPRVGLPPCGLCPKKSPEEAKQLELSPRNYQALAYYRQVVATGGHVPMDAVTARNCGLIDPIIRQHETRVAMEAVVMPLMIGRGTGGVLSTKGEDRGRKR
jgi:hypothetical protein